MDAEAYALARVEVRFSAVGNDERIHHLNKMTKRRLAGKKGFVSKYRSIHLFIGVALGERRALKIASRWLEKHCELLQELDAHKVIELQTCFRLEDGSRILALEPSFADLLVRADCTFWHQTARLFPSPPTTTMRKEKKAKA